MLDVIAPEIKVVLKEGSGKQEFVQYLVRANLCFVQRGDDLCVLVSQGHAQEWLRQLNELPFVQSAELIGKAVS